MVIVGWKSADNTVICDENLNMVIHVAPLDELNDKCLKGCIEKHERSHLEDLKAQGRSCKGRKPNDRVGFATKELHKESERKAYAAEVTCLKAKIKDCDECKEVAERRILQLQTEVHQYD